MQQSHGLHCSTLIRSVFHESVSGSSAVGAAIRAALHVRSPYKTGYLGACVAYADASPMVLVTLMKSASMELTVSAMLQEGLSAVCESADKAAWSDRALCLKSCLFATAESTLWGLLQC